MSILSYGRQNITDEDIREVIRVLNSDYLTQGPEIDIFERAFADYLGCEYAVAVSNGTAALHLSALALGVKAGDKVITSPITFSASANCIRYCGGEVVFSDIDPTTYLLDIEKLKRLIENAPPGYYKGIIPVDFSGRPIDLEKLRKIAEKNKLWIIEDACHAPGGYFIDSGGTAQRCGNGQFADLAIFSFHPVKHIACGEGGMITTNNSDLYRRLKKLRTHGITKDPGELEENHGEWYYEMQELGYNYRLTDFQAALGTSQLQRAEDGLKRRIELASIYYNAFKDKPFIKGQSGLFIGHAYHLYIIEVEDRDLLYKHLRKHSIFAQVHYIPVHLMPYYKKRGWKNGDFPVAENYYSKCLSLPMYPTLREEEQKYVIETVNNYYLDWVSKK